MFSRRGSRPGATATRPMLATPNQSCPPLATIVRPLATVRFMVSRWPDGIPLGALSISSLSPRPSDTVPTQGRAGERFPTSTGLTTPGRTPRSAISARRMPRSCEQFVRSSFVAPGPFPCFQGYPSTAAKQGAIRIGALQQPFNGDSWVPARRGIGPNSLRLRQSTGTT